jgi:hypothetical protein
MTMTTGAADPFRFRRIENRAGDPYPGGRAGPECRPEPVGSGSEPAVRTGPNWSGLGPVWFLFGWAVSSPPDKANKPSPINDLAHTALRYLPFPPRFALSGHSVGHIAA